MFDIQAVTAATPSLSSLAASFNSLCCLHVHYERNYSVEGPLVATGKAPALRSHMHGDAGGGIRNGQCPIRAFLLPR